MQGAVSVTCGRTLYAPHAGCEASLPRQTKSTSRKRNSSQEKKSISQKGLRQLCQAANSVFTAGHILNAIASKLERISLNSP